VFFTDGLNELLAKNWEQLSMSTQLNTIYYHLWIYNSNLTASGLTNDFTLYILVRERLVSRNDIGVDIEQVANKSKVDRSNGYILK
jgi:hypothetical protein